LLVEPFFPFYPFAVLSMCVAGLEACPFQRLYMGKVHVITFLEGTEVEVDV